MSSRQRTGVVGLVAACCAFAAYAATPEPDSELLGNSYYLYTNALNVDDEGVVPVPSRFQWSVETSLRGFTPDGAPLPDNRVLLRLYDPDHNFTALTAQMDLATAAKLQQELAKIVARKSADPNFQQRPQLYDPRVIPMRRIVGIDAHGQVTLEDVPTSDTPETPSE